MTLDTTAMNALANEARRQELKTKEANLQGNADALASLAALLSQTLGDVQRRLVSVRAERAAQEAGAGPGITGAFGLRTDVDNFATEERTVGQAAAIDFIKANPDCPAEDAIGAWVAGVAAWLPEGALPTHSPAGLLALYTQVLLAGGRIPEGTWDHFRAFVAVTPRETLLGL